MPHNKIKGDYGVSVIQRSHFNAFLLHGCLCQLVINCNLSEMSDLSCVSHMPFLAILDASHNEISNFFGFQPPKNLKVTEDLELTG